MSEAPDGRPIDPELGLSLGSVGRLPAVAVVHDDARAAATADSLDALAVTAGPHIYFGVGQYQPRTARGRRLIAHELAHVAQQKDAPDAQPEPAIPSARWESEAASFADAVERGGVLPALTTDRRGVVALRGKSGAATKTGRHAAEIEEVKRKIAVRYPHLAEVLTPAQLDQIHDVLVARAEWHRLAAKAAPYERSITRLAGGWGGPSEDVEMVERIHAQMEKPGEVAVRGQILVVPTELLLADDVLKGADDFPAQAAFRARLIAEAKSTPVVLKFLELPDPDDIQFDFWWSDARIGNDGGLIRWKDFMRFQELNLRYEQILLTEQIRILGQMKEISYQALSPEEKLRVDITEDDFEVLRPLLTEAGLEAGHMAGLRDAYAKGCQEIWEVAKLMLAKERSIDEVANWAVEARNMLKEQIRDEGPRLVKVLAEARNLRKYGNVVGPTAEELRAGGRTSEEIIEGVVRSNPSVTHWAGRLRIAGRIMIAIDIGIGIINVLSAPLVDMPRVLIEETGAIAGGIAGGAQGARAGAAAGGLVGELFGPEAAPVGAAIGGLLGGIGGAIGGAWAGRKAGRWVAKELFPPKETKFEGAFQ
jgi:hypothetical protein